MGESGQKATAKAWKAGAGANLTHLDISNNDLGPAGSEALAEAWRAGWASNLIHLDLSYNRLISAGAEALTEYGGMRAMPGPPGAQPAGNQVGKKAMELLRTACQQRCQIQC